jgi:hypothetical protein
MQVRAIAVHATGATIGAMALEIGRSYERARQLHIRCGLIPNRRSRNAPRPSPRTTRAELTRHVAARRAAVAAYDCEHMNAPASEVVEALRRNFPTVSIAQVRADRRRVIRSA